jgi:hypothetical protein
MELWPGSGYSREYPGFEDSVSMLGTIVRRFFGAESVFVKSNLVSSTRVSPGLVVTTLKQRHLSAGSC